MSFMLTTEQVRARTKDVTRRLGWAFLKSGDMVQAVVKCQGLKKGERVEKLAVLRVRSVHREILWTLSAEEVAREGFLGMSPKDFVVMFCRGHVGATPESLVTRIAFEYVEPPQEPRPPAARRSQA